MKTACGTKTCIAPVLGADAEGSTCGDRISGLQGKGMAQLDACLQIAGHDFPEMCGFGKEGKSGAISADGCKGKCSRA